MKENKMRCCVCGKGQTLFGDIYPSPITLVCVCGNQEVSKWPFKQFELVTNQPIYRVYAAKLLGEDEMIQFCVNNVREVSFRREVEAGDFLIELDSLQLTYETFDANEAIRMATQF
jgi:hypothetical protein